MTPSSWQINIADKILSGEWSEIHLIETINYQSRKKEDYSSQTYAYRQSGAYYRQTLHDNSIRKAGRFVQQRMWDDPKPLDKAAFRELVAGKERLDTVANKKKLASAQAQLDRHKQEEDSRRKNKRFRPPRCALCGSSMVKRLNPREKRHFWGCPDFPSCRGSRSIEE